MKQDSLDTYNERDPFKNDDARDEEDDPEDTDSGIEGEVDPLDRDVIIQPPLPPPLLRPPTERISFPKGLPWAPKVRLMARFQFCFEPNPSGRSLPVKGPLWNEELSAPKTETAYPRHQSVSS